jgi:hypothetical protein
MHTQSTPTNSLRYNPLIAIKDGFLLATNEGKFSGGFSPVLSAAEVEKPKAVATESNNCHGGNCAAHCGVKLE